MDRDVQDATPLSLPISSEEQAAHLKQPAVHDSESGMQPPPSSSSLTHPPSKTPLHQLQALTDRLRPSPAIRNLYTPNVNWASTSYFPSTSSGIPSTPDLTMLSSEEQLQGAMSQSSDYMDNADSEHIDDVLQISHDEGASNLLHDYDPETMDKYDNLEAALPTSQSHIRESEGIGDVKEDPPPPPHPGVSEAVSQGPLDFLYTDFLYDGEIYPAQHRLSLRKDDMINSRGPTVPLTGQDVWMQEDPSLQHPLGHDSHALEEQDGRPHSQRMSQPNKLYTDNHQSDTSPHQMNNLQDYSTQPRDSSSELPLPTLEKMTMHNSSPSWQESNGMEPNQANRLYQYQADADSSAANDSAYPQAFSDRLAYINEQARSTMFLNTASMEAFNRQVHLREKGDKMHPAMDVDVRDNILYDNHQHEEDETQSGKKRRGNERTHLDVSEGNGNVQKADIVADKRCLDSEAGSSTTSVANTDHYETSTSMQSASMKRRLNEAIHLCPIPGCDSAFTRKYNLQGHLRSHSGARPYICEEPHCDKAFARSYDLKRHEKLHNGVKDYKCKNCRKSFARPDALARHMRSDLGHENCSSLTLQDDDATSQVSTPTSTIATATGSIRASSPSHSSSHTASQTKRRLSDTPESKDKTQRLEAMRQKMRFKGFPL